jgi:drug/metabolite transporter (DMT)-like permease
VAALFAGATVWGLVWYPYRLIEAAGMSGLLATTLTYAVALVLGLALFYRQLRGVRVDRWLVAIAIASAGCNLGYVLAVLHGEIMRVLLLFYLAPLWTVLLARLLLNERLTRAGLAVVALSLTGATIMLWHPETGLPWPRQGAEWLGLGAGFMFALSNVLIRRADHYSIALKSMAVFAGIVLIGLLGILLLEPVAVPAASGRVWALLLAVGVVLLVINPVVQYGLARVAAGRAIVIFLFELMVAAFASWWLADEVMDAREWLGGALIVAASLFSAKLES